MIFIDLDNFKEVNDRCGHPTGDRCLERVVELIGSVVIKKGRLYRYGSGDEFVALLPNFEIFEAKATGERIRKAIEDGNPGEGIKVTASIGIVSSDQLQMADPKMLLKAADQAMYSAKNSGKNQVRIWKEQEGSLKGDLAVAAEPPAAGVAIDPPERGILRDKDFDQRYRQWFG